MTARGDGPDGVRARLREAADAHEPDRARVLARVERGMAVRPGDRPGRRGRPAPAGWVRVAGAVAAVAGVLAAGGYVVASAVREPGTGGRTVAVAPAVPPAAGTAHSGTPAPRGSSSGVSPGSSSGVSPGISSGAARGGQDGPLRSAGAVNAYGNAYWAQNDVTLTVTERLTSLTLRLDVARTAGVASTGAWLTLPEDDFTLTVTGAPGVLRYTWTLRAGRTVGPGAWVFAGQYNHARGDRDAGSDVYRATGHTADGQRAAVTGHFTEQGVNGG